MNTSSVVGAVFLVVAALVTPYAALGQHGFAFTKTVDPSGEADYTSIQDAIDACLTPGANERYTVLIYAGVYDDEALTLDNADPRIDLVGVDRDAVIIKPPADTDAITIQGDGARNNTIRNLTIITDDDDQDQGRGVVVKEQTTGGTPTAVKIVDVTIKCEGEKSNAIDIEERAQDIEIRNVHVTCNGKASTGIYVAAPVANALIRDVTIKTTHGNGIEITSAANAQGKRCNNIDIEDVHIECCGSGSYALKGHGAKSIPGGRRVRIDAITLYAEADTSGKVSPARKP